MSKLAVVKRGYIPSQTAPFYTQPSRADFRGLRFVSCPSSDGSRLSDSIAFNAERLRLDPLDRSRGGGSSPSDRAGSSKSSDNVDGVDFALTNPGSRLS